MKIVQKPLELGGPVSSNGFLEVTHGKKRYVTLETQKPLMHGHDLVIFDPEASDGPTELVGPRTIPAGGISETVDKGSVPASRRRYDLATEDPVIVNVAKRWIRGKLPLGEVDLSEFEQ